MAESADRKLIDANVVRSAGDAPHDSSRSCRRFLETVLGVGHHVVMNSDIWAEWRSHLSRYSMVWYRMMEEEDRVHSDDAVPDERLRKQIGDAVPDRRQAAEKDVHLIEAALRTDSLVASQDERARRIFRDASGSVRELRPIVWVNPTRPADDPIRWLEGGAPFEAWRRLGAA